MPSHRVYRCQKGQCGIHHCYNTERFHSPFSIGNERRRIRVASNMTTLPCSSASLIVGKLASNRANWDLGFLYGWRSRITEGFLSCHNASSVPKSVSAETNTRFSTAARLNISSSEADCIHNPARAWHHIQLALGLQ